MGHSNFVEDFTESKGRKSYKPGDDKKSFRPRGKDRNRGEAEYERPEQRSFNERGAKPEERPAPVPFERKYVELGPEHDALKRELGFKVMGSYRDGAVAAYHLHLDGGKFHLIFHKMGDLKEHIEFCADHPHLRKEWTTKKGTH